MFNVMKNKLKLVQLSATLYIFEQNKGFGGRNTFRRIRKGVRGVMGSQKGSMIRWAQWNGCLRRLPVPTVSDNPPTRLQCIELSTTSLQCFTFLTLSLSAMVVPLLHSFSLYLCLYHCSKLSLYFALSLSLSLSHTHTLCAPHYSKRLLSFALSLSCYSREKLETFGFLSLSLLCFALSLSN